MYSQRAVLSALTVCLLIAARGLAADVLDAIPNQALAVVLVNRLEATGSKIEKLAAKFGAPPISLLMLARLQTGIHEGLDEKGTVALALMPAGVQSPAAGPVPVPVPVAPIAFVPVSDYVRFVAQLQPDNADAKIAHVTVAGKPALVCRRGDFAVLTLPEFEAVLKEVLAATESVSADLKPLASWLSKVELACVVSPAGIQMLGAAAPMQMESQSAQASMPTESGIAGFLPPLSSSGPALAAACDELKVAAIGVAIEKSGTLRVTTGVRFTPGGKWSAIAASMATKNSQPLAGLPEGPVVAAAALQFNKPLQRLADRIFSARGMALNPVLASLAPEQQGIISDALRQMWAEQQMQSIWLGAALPGEPLLAHSAMVSKVDDASQFLTQLEEAWNALELPTGDDSPRMAPGVIHHFKIDGRKALEIVGNGRQIKEWESSLGDAGSAAAVKLFGPARLVRLYVTAIDKQTVVWAYNSEANLRQAIAAAGRPRGSSSPADAPAAETLALMPSGAQAVLLLELSGLVDWAQALRPMSVDSQSTAVKFPAAPPIGISLKIASTGAKGEIVIPAGTLDAIGRFVASTEFRLIAAGPQSAAKIPAPLPEFQTAER